MVEAFVCDFGVCCIYRVVVMLQVELVVMVVAVCKSLYLLACRFF